MMPLIGPNANLSLKPTKESQNENNGTGQKCSQGNLSLSTFPILLSPPPIQQLSLIKTFFPVLYQDRLDDLERLKRENECLKEIREAEWPKDSSLFSYIQRNWGTPDIERLEVDTVKIYRPKNAYDPDAWISKCEKKISQNSPLWKAIHCPEFRKKLLSLMKETILKYGEYKTSPDPENLKPIDKKIDSNKGRIAVIEGAIKNDSIDGCNAFDIKMTIVFLYRAAINNSSPDLMRIKKDGQDDGTCFIINYDTMTVEFWDCDRDNRFPSYQKLLLLLGISSKDVQKHVDAAVRDKEWAIRYTLRKDGALELLREFREEFPQIEKFFNLSKLTFDTFPKDKKKQPLLCIVPLQKVGTDDLGEECFIPTLFGCRIHQVIAQQVEALFKTGSYDGLTMRKNDEIYGNHQLHPIKIGSEKLEVSEKEPSFELVDKEDQALFTSKDFYRYSHFICDGLGFKEHIRNLDFDGVNLEKVLIKPSSIKNKQFQIVQDKSQSLYRVSQIMLDHHGKSCEYYIQMDWEHFKSMLINHTVKTTPFVFDREAIQKK